MSDELDDLIEEADWYDYTRRALIYAAHRLADRGRHEGKRGKTPHEYVHKAVFKILNGEYEYRGGGLFALLCAAIDDLITKDVGRP